MDWPIAGWQQVSYCDWPKHLSTVLFLPHCDLACPTCHNKSLAHPKEKFLYFDMERIINFINDKDKWLDGVVISGGEPLVFPRIKDLCTYIKEKTNTLIKLDTNGMHPDELEALIKAKCIDTVAMDIKAPYYLYPEVTGMPTKEIDYFKKTIESTLKILVDNSDTITSYFRTTKVPMVNTPEILEIIKSYVPEGHDYHLQTFVDRNDS